MKKYIITMACAVCVMSFSAQRASAADDIKDYNRVGVSYDYTNYTTNYGEDGLKSNGFGIDYIHGFSVSSKLPLYIETGLNLNYGSAFESLEAGIYDTDFYYYYEQKLTTFNMQVPVNVAWKFGIGDNFAITPYAGLNFKLNLSDKLKITEDDESYTYSLFDSEETDKTWNRFQMGWHVGVGFQFKPIYLGVQYGTDFIHCMSYEKAHIDSRNLKVTLAYVF